MIDSKHSDYSHILSTLDDLQKWMRLNKVTVNQNKTVIMHITTSTAAAPPPVGSMNGTPPQVVETTKLLGVTIDNRLTWKEHVSHTTTSASHRLCLLRQLK